MSKGVDLKDQYSLKVEEPDLKNSTLINNSVESTFLKGNGEQLRAVSRL